MIEITRVFLKFGFLGFGGPIAVMAMFEEEFCQRRRWLTRERFAEMYAVLKMMPGPLATQMAVHLGTLRGGILGGVWAGALFILPAFAVVLGLSYFYFHTGAVAQASDVFNGLQAAALVVIAISTFQLAAPYRREARAWVIALVSAALVIDGPRLEPLIIFGAGLLGVLAAARGAGGASGTTSGARGDTARGGGAVGGVAGAVAGLAGAGAWMNRALAGVGALGVGGGLAAIAGGASSATVLRLVWVCFKAGAFVFGSGLAIVPLLEGDTVHHYHWLTHSQFMDGLAFGQITPGPVVITATFIGYKTAGWLGAVLATLFIFLPSFINVLFIVPRVWSRVSGSRAGEGFIAWAIPAVIGCILGTTARLSWLTLTTWPVIVIFVLLFALALRFHAPSWFVIPLGGVLAALARFI